jgi:O-antigen/teichoic acid export membrane protein
MGSWKIGNKFHNKEFKKYFFNTLWLFSEKIARVVVGLFLTIWVTRYLGPEQFGIYSYALSFVGIFNAIITLGLDDITIRELIKNKSKEVANQILGTSFALKFISSIVMMGVIVVIARFNTNSDSESLIFIFLMAYIFQSFNVIGCFYQAKAESKYIVIASSLSMAVSSIIKIYLLLNNGTLYQFVLVYLLDSVVVALGLIYFYVQQNNNIYQWKFSRVIAKQLLKDSSPLIISGSLTLVYTKVDQIMINSMLGVIEVGYYAAAIRLTEFWYYVPMLIVGSIFPKIIEYKKNSKELYQSKLEKLHTFLYMISITIVTIVFFNSDRIIDILYGHQYSNSAVVLQIHIFSFIFVSLSAASSRWVYIENLQYTAIYRVLFAAILNIVLNYIFIPSHGIKAAAAATLFSQVISSYAMYGLINKTRYIFRMQTRIILFQNLFKKKEINTKTNAND